jgi:hypothetical protein
MFYLLVHPTTALLAKRLWLSFHCPALLSDCASVFL